jgi:hypothetical protein
LLIVGVGVVGLVVVGDEDGIGADLVVGVDVTAPLDAGPEVGPDVVGRGVTEEGVIGLDGGLRAGFAVVDWIVGVEVVGEVRLGRAAAGLDDGEESGDGVLVGLVVGKIRIGVAFGALVPVRRRRCWAAHRARNGGDGPG